MVEDIETANVIRRWLNTGEESEVMVARLTDEIDGFQDQHPLDEQIFYWLDEDEWAILVSNKAVTIDDFRLTIVEESNSGE